MTNEIDKPGNTTRLSGLDTFMPPAEAVSLLVEQMAMRLHRDKWQVPDDRLREDWATTPEKAKEELRGYARSAMNFTREQIQRELQKGNLSLDLVKHDAMPVRMIHVPGYKLTDEQRRLILRLSDDYFRMRSYPEGDRFTLQIRAHFKKEEWGALDVLGFEIRETKE